MLEKDHQWTEQWVVKIVFGSKLCHEINARVITHVMKSFINGEYDNDLMDYHVIGIGGAAIFLSFLNCTNSTSIKLKLS